MHLKFSHKRIIHTSALAMSHGKAQSGLRKTQPSKQDEPDMKLLKLTLPVAASLSLAGCMDSAGANAVARAPTPAASCDYLQGISPDHAAMIGSVRCGPQAEVPYTYAN